jgi:putative pyoverdin transport system ATP-binding/permease protein
LGGELVYGFTIGLLGVSAMPVILLLLKSSWRSMVLAIAMGGISGVCSAMAISMVSKAVGGDPSVSLSTFALLTAIALATGITSQFLLIQLAQDSIYGLRFSLSRRILSAPLAKIEQLGAGKLLATLTEDVAVLSNMIAVIPFLCIDLALIGSCLVYLASLSGVVFGVTIGIILVSVVLIQGAIGKANHLFYGAREQEDKLLENFRSITDGIKELKLHWQRRQEFLDGDLKMNADASRERSIKALHIFAVTAGLGQTVFFATMGLILFALPQWLNVSLATLSSYVLTLTYLMTPLQNMVQRLPALVRANVAIRKIESLGLALAEKNEDDRRAPEPTQPIQSLQLVGVTHTYQGEEQSFHLGPIDLTFQGNQVVFIVGGNGSGKSTLAKILTGLYQPDQGSIVLDGRSINNDNLEWYRQHYAVVLSDFYLFDRLLGMAMPNLDQEAQRYLKLLQIEHKVQIKDGRLSTTNLSQGQRKRLALLTAYLEDRPIYLFDEWAADQDPLFRELFYQELLPELKQRGKTVFAISHDDRYFHLADRVIKLDYGKLESDATA